MYFGHILRKLRISHKFSQTEIAEQIGVCQSTYCAWESDRSSPKVEHCVKLANIFNIDLNELLSRSVELNDLPTKDLIDKQNGINELRLYEDLTISQKQVILMQQYRIEQLETENEYLRGNLKND